MARCVHTLALLLGPSTFTSSLPFTCTRRVINTKHARTLTHTHAHTHAHTDEDMGPQVDTSEPEDDEDRAMQGKKSKEEDPDADIWDDSVCCACVLLRWCCLRC